MVKAKTWVLKKHFEGLPKNSDLELVEEDLPSLKPGEFLIEAEYLSVDPYMRPYSKHFNEGSVMFGGQIGKVIESRNSNYAVGSYVVANAGWRTHSILTGDAPGTYVFPVNHLPRSLALGTLGMPGITAYFGFPEVCKPKEGETVLVNAAAGAVGSIVGQIAKMKGCKVIGYAGTDDKCAWLKELGFDQVFNYKTVELKKNIKEAAPDGIDCYFDNVGGEFSDTVLQHMKDFGRVACCGAISGYNDTPKKGDQPYFVLIQKQLKVEGFNVFRWYPQWMEAIKQMATWITEEKISYRETTTVGFENMPKAFIGLFTGDNIGKAVVKV